MAKLRHKHLQMTKIILILFWAFPPISAYAVTPVDQALNLYVAPNGRDQWTGISAHPGDGDGPLASLAGARDRLRALRKAGALPMAGAVVRFEAGLYPQAKAVRFTKEDTGTTNGPIIFTGPAGATAHLSGGVTISGFAHLSGLTAPDTLVPGARSHVLQADLRTQGITDYGDPGTNECHSDVVFKDHTMTLARWPNAGYVQIESAEVETPTAEIIHYEGDRPNRWFNEPAVWLFGYWYWNWAADHERVATIDPKQRTITLAPPLHRYGYRKGGRWYAYNLLSELDEPGEYYIDQNKGILYFWPPSPIRKVVPSLTLANHLVEIAGASHLRFENLTFEESRGTAVVTSDVNDINITNCVLRNIGGWAVNLSGTASEITDCEITELGEGGILLCGGDRNHLKAGDLRAANNEIHNFGLWKPDYQPAIQLQGVGNEAIHNLIYDGPHSAILFSGNDHRIEFNEIHHVCLESNDAGAVYASRSWSDRGTVIRSNFLHDLSGLGGAGCVGVYLDDQFSGTLVVGNVFQRVAKGILVGGGRDNVMANNAFLECDLAICLDARGLEASTNMSALLASLDAVPFKQELWIRHYPDLANILANFPMAPKGNQIYKNVCTPRTKSLISSRAATFLNMKQSPNADGTVIFDVASGEIRSSADIDFETIYTKMIGIHSRNH
jgi:hypothetical protein